MAPQVSWFALLSYQEKENPFLIIGSPLIIGTFLTFCLVFAVLRGKGHGQKGIEDF